MAKVPVRNHVMNSFPMFNNSKTIRIAGRALLWCLVALPCVQAAEIQIKQSATVDNDLILLEDIAEIRSVSPEARKKLAAIEIGPAPLNGQSHQLSYRTIRSRLLANGANLADLRMTGQRAVLVARSVEIEQKKPTPKKLAVKNVTATSRERLQAEKILEPVLHSYLQEHAPKLGKVSLNIGLPSEVAREFSRVLPRSVVVLGVSALSQDRYRFRVSGTQFNRNPVEALLVVQVKSWPFVLAANASLPKGHVVSTADLNWIQQEETSGSFTRIDQVVGREVVRSLRPDEPLENSDLRNTPLIRRNDKVTVYVRTSAFVVQKVFRAREDGALGDIIELANDNGKIVAAKVTAFHEAEIELGAPTPKERGGQTVPLTNTSNSNPLPRPQLSTIPERPFDSSKESAPQKQDNWSNHSAETFHEASSVKTVGFDSTSSPNKGVTWSNKAAKRSR